MEFLKVNNSRDFLNAALSGTSIRKLSRKMGYTSDRGVGMVLKGQRPMSSEMQMRLIRLLKLTPKEQLHLQNILRRERHPADADSGPTESQNVSTTLPGERLHPLIPAYSLVILELFRTSARALSVIEIQKRLRQRVSAMDLKTTLKNMEQAALIKQEPSGYFRALKEHEYVASTQDIPSQVIRGIHRAQLKRAADTLEEQFISEREFISKTLTVSAARLPEIKRLIRESLEELATQIGQEKGGDDSVVSQLNIQFYLQSKAQK